MNRSLLLRREEYQGKNPKDIHVLMTEKITDIAHGLLAQAKSVNSYPTVLLSHVTYSEVMTGFSEFALENEPLLMPEATEGYDLTLLAHIHKAQNIRDKVYYCGSPERLSFSEEENQPGFYIFDFDISGRHEAQFIETPARRFVTLDQSDPMGRATNIQNAIVRVRMKTDDVTAKGIDRRRLERDLYEGGAWYVAGIDITAEQTERARDATVTEEITPLMALQKYLTQQAIPDDRAERLLSMAGELMAGGVAE
jgi:exonuclease SbcC/exonuclease SbcD